MKALVRLVEKAQFSPAYDTMQDRILGRFKAALAAMPGLDSAIREWRHMRRRDQTYFLERCATMLAKIQTEESGVAVHPAAIAWRAADYLGTVRGQAHYNLNDAEGIEDLIEIRSDTRNGLRSLADALNTLVHEQTHIMQAFLARASLFKTMETADPLHGDAALAAFTLTGGYVPHELSRDAYRAQCVERDAFRAGRAAGDFMKDARRDALRGSGANAAQLTAAAAIGVALLAGCALLGSGRRTP
jgi:hypothetical protein